MTNFSGKEIKKTKGRKSRNLLFILCFFFFISNSQNVYSQLQNPTGLKWKTIKTEHFNIVFPQEIVSDGLRVANLMEFLYQPVSKSFDIKPKILNLFLFNQSTVSNGYAGLAPTKAVWYNTPPQDVTQLGAGDWYQLLGIHEYRHFAQYERTNDNVTYLLSLFLGDYGQTISFFSIPAWYWEGDAVAMETALTKTGRGRIPTFDMAIRAQLLEGIKLPYHTAFLGSLKDYYPNYYALGYHLVTRVRRQYGQKAWNEVLNRSSYFPYWPWVFSRSSKKLIGVNNAENYNATVNELDSLWRKQIKGLKFSNTNKINTLNKKFWTNYYNPQYTSDGSIIASKYGIDNPMTLISISPDGHEKKLFEADTYDKFSLSADKIVWESSKPDIRWGERIYSNLFIYDLKTKSKKRLTRKSNYFAPSISPDGKKIATISYNTENKCNLFILDAQSGKILKQFENQTNEMIRTPAWSEDGKNIVYTHCKFKGQALSMINTETDAITTILPYSYENIGRPVFYGNFIIYNSPFNGIDNIYAVNYLTGQRYIVVSRKYGSYNPSVSQDGKRLVFQDYAVKGFDVNQIELDSTQWKKIENVEVREVKYFEPLIDQELGKNVYDTEIPKDSFDIEDYKPGRHIFKLHSWMILPAVPISQVYLFSDNLLNTTKIMAGTEFNFNEKAPRIFANASFSKLYPIFDVGISYGKRTAQIADSTPIAFTTWNETATTFGIRLPFDFSQGIWWTNLTLGASLQYVNISNKDQDYIGHWENGNGEFFPLHYRLNFTTYKQISRRDINPSLGFISNCSFHHTPFDGNYHGDQLSLNATAYLPGFFNHHSIHFEASLEQQNPENYRFVSELAYTRGFTYQYHDTYYKLSANYELPLFYPDLNLAEIVYIKRVKANLFYDYSIGKTGNKSENLQSTGAEILFDFNPFNLLYTFDIGLRCSYHFKDGEIRYNGIFLGLVF